MVPCALKFKRDLTPRPEIIANAHVLGLSNDLSPFDANCCFAENGCFSLGYISSSKWESDRFLEITEAQFMNLGNAAKAVEELKLEEIPFSWIKYIQCGWTIEATSCTCGGNWAWLKPRPSGAKGMHGCVCHNELDVAFILNTKLDSFSSLTKRALKAAKPKSEDIGKIFYTLPGSETGIIVPRVEFNKLDPANVGWWIEIDEFDIELE